MSLEKLLECSHLPAQLLDEVGSILGNFLWKLNHVNASKDDVVGFHRVGARKRRTERHSERHSEQVNDRGASSRKDDPYLPVSSSYIRIPRDQ